MQNDSDLADRMLTEFLSRDSERRPHETAVWHKAAPLALTADASAEDALVEALRNGLEHLSANRPCVLDRAHEEGVHQMRVACRRLRSRLALYESLIPADDRAPLDAALKWLIGRLGPARDWDVFLLEVVTSARERFPDDDDLARLVSAATERRDRGYDRAGAALASHRYAALEALLAAWTEERPWRTASLTDGQAAALAGPVRDFADAVVRERHASLLAKGADFEAMAPEERHRLRIEIKKVRYAAEFFGSLYDDRRVRAYLGSLKALQDDLGAANDRAVARDLMLRLAAKAPKAERIRLAYAAGLVMASQPAVATSETGLITLWRSFADGPTYWD